MKTGELAELDRLRPVGAAYVKRSFTGRKGLNYQDAEDVVSDVIVKLWQTVEDVEGSGNLRALFFTACKNRAIDLIRSRDCPKNTPIPTEGEPSTEEQLEDRLLLREIFDGLAGLNANRRRTIELRLGGLGEAELAEAMNCSVPAAKKRLHNARKQLVAAGVGA